MRNKGFTFIGLALIVALASSLVTVTGVSAAVAATCQNVHTTDLSTWDLSDTRTQGHNQIVAGGLRVWTDSNTSQDKAAGYHLLTAPLSDITTGSIAYTTALGTIPPGLQIRFVVDDGGTPRFGTLIGEATNYGNNWWLTNGSAPYLKAGAPHNGGGFGSPYYGTLAEWGTAFPGAQVYSIGYSLGSGVLGDYTITSLTFGCNVFTFGLPGLPPPPAAIPPSAGFACLVMVDTPVSEPFYPQWLDGRDWMDWDGFVIQDLDKNGGIEISLHNHAGESNSYQYYRVLGNNGTQLRYFERIQGGVCVEIGDPVAGDS